MKTLHLNMAGLSNASPSLFNRLLFSTGTMWSGLRNKKHLLKRKSQKTISHYPQRNKVLLLLSHINGTVWLTQRITNVIETASNQQDGILWSSICINFYLQFCFMWSVCDKIQKVTSLMTSVYFYWHGMTSTVVKLTIINCMHFPCILFVLIRSI